MAKSKSRKIPPACPACGSKLKEVQTSTKGIIGRYVCRAEYLDEVPPKEIRPCPSRM